MMILLFIAMLPVEGGPVVERFDRLHVNHLYNECGDKIFTQLLAERWSDRSGCYHVHHWHLIKTPQQTVRRGATGDYEAWCEENEQTYILRSRLFRESWTQNDVEMSDRALLRPSDRRGLSKPWVKEP